jgi:ABC-2 type transport system permease protein
MYFILIKQFFRSKTVLLAFGILMILGVLSIGTGKQFLTKKQEVIAKTKIQQENHIKTQTNLHKDDLGLLLYYLKFSFINPVNSLASISIGQSDLNSHIQNVTILNLEGQKYDTDLVNPMRLHAGNLDISFLIIFLFPLIIIALNFNILSEEIEKGTWKMIIIQGKSSFLYLLKKLSIRLLFVFILLGFLFLLAKIILEIPFNTSFLQIITMSYLYVLFWFSICFFVVLLRKSSNTNAIVLLSSWLVLVVFLPVLVNNYITNKYPVEEAFTMTIKQRDEYHKKWDTDKKETLDKFYDHYPQFSHYELQEEGFSWLWYYAMQQMGDDESKQEKDAMYLKIEKRELLSKKIAQFFPPIQMQLAMNDIANTSLTHQINFLNATTNFHEDLRLQFYPKIFDKKSSSSVNWKNYKPEFYKSDNSFNLINNILYMVIISLLLIGFGVIRNLKHFT